MQVTHITVTFMTEFHLSREVIPALVWFYNLFGVRNITTYNQTHTHSEMNALVNALSTQGGIL